MRDTAATSTGALGLKMEPVRSIQQLLVVGHLDLRWLRQVRKRHPDSRTVFWGVALDNARALSSACALSHRLIVQDELLPLFSEHVQRGTTLPLERLSDFDPKLASSCPEAPVPEACASDGKGVFPVADGPVLFCPSNDTHTLLFEPIAKRLSNARFLLHDNRPEERAREMIESLDLQYVEGGAEKLEEIRPSVIVVGNDWYEGVWALFQRAYALEIPTVCIQEGCLDFASGPRMQRCDYPLMQGPIMLDHLLHDVYFLTGNPRFDHLESLPLPKSPVAMLNCNFTYGVEERSRDAWIEAAARACEEIEIDFFLSQHPRDKGIFPSLPVRPSHAGVVHDHIVDCSILVTRFSTLVYEALLCGRQVVYFNPHNEKMRLFREDRTGGLHIATDSSGLVKALQCAWRAGGDAMAPRRNEFLGLHCGESDGQGANRCAAALAAISLLGHPRLGSRLRDMLEMRMYRRNRRRHSRRNRKPRRE